MNKWIWFYWFLLLLWLMVMEEGNKIKKAKQSSQSEFPLYRKNREGFGNKFLFQNPTDEDQTGIGAIAHLNIINNNNREGALATSNTSTISLQDILADDIDSYTANYSGMKEQKEDSSLENLFLAFPFLRNRNHGFSHNHNPYNVYSQEEPARPEKKQPQKRWSIREVEYQTNGTVHFSDLKVMHNNLNCRKSMMLHAIFLIFIALFVTGVISICHWIVNRHSPANSPPVLPLKSHQVKLSQGSMSMV